MQQTSITDFFAAITPYKQEEQGSDKGEQGYDQREQGQSYDDYFMQIAHVPFDQLCKKIMNYDQLIADM